jgi:3-hydroxybutyryl-CoA dehydrogenase
MTVNDIKNVSVIGCGTMGNGIAQVFAQCGYGVTLIDIDQVLLDRAVVNIGKSMDRQIKKEVITEADKAAALARIKTSADLKAAANSDLVIEAVTENLQVKLDIFKKLKEISRADAILASNTSSLPITQLATATGKPDRFIGMHFMNPVPMMKLIELIRGMATSQATFDLISELSKKLGKTPVEVNDYPGFIANRILMPMLMSDVRSYGSCSGPARLRRGEEGHGARWVRSAGRFSSVL